MLLYKEMLHHTHLWLQWLVCLNVAFNWVTTLLIPLINSHCNHRHVCKSISLDRDETASHSLAFQVHYDLLFPQLRKQSYHFLSPGILSNVNVS